MDDGRADGGTEKVRERCGRTEERTERGTEDQMERIEGQMEVRTDRG